MVGGVGLVAYTYGRNAAPQTASTTPDVSDVSGTPSTPTASAPTVTMSTLVVVSSATAVLTGTVVPNGAQTAYWYDYGRTDSLGTRSNTQDAGSGFVRIATPAFINNLSSNTQYSARLNATNAYGTVSGQIYRFTTNSTVPSVSATLPIIRTDLSLSLARTSATLNGQVNPNGSETSYWFEYGVTNNLGNTTAILSAGNSTIAQAISIPLSGLKPLTTYYYRLDAQNQYGTVNSSILTFITTGPAVTSVPTVSTLNPISITPSTVTLRGQVNPNDTATTYWFQYGTDPLGGTVLGGTTRTIVTGTMTLSVTANVSGLKPLTKYYYQLMANNGSGIVHGVMVPFTTAKNPPKAY
jgi:hypothetical protein